MTGLAWKPIAVIPALGRPRHGDPEFEGSLGYRVRLSQKTNSINSPLKHVAYGLPATSDDSRRDGENAQGGSWGLGKALRVRQYLRFSLDRVPVPLTCCFPV